MPRAEVKNESKWNELFAERDILQDVDTKGVHVISAKAINEKREARLMTKFDHHINLPSIFRKNGLAILPNSRSSYVIGRFNCYANLPDSDQDDIIEASLPTDLASINAENLYSESAALLCAQHANLIADALEVENVRLTVFGRQTTERFDFSISENNSAGAPAGSRALSIDRAQFEIDGGFESSNLFAILEAKNVEVEDFHIRQLYFPFRAWLGKLSKPIIPVFFTYSNEIFSFYVYQFTQPDNYNSLELVRRRRYRIVQSEIEVADIRAILATVPIKPEPDSRFIPFPQADRFERVIEIITNLRGSSGTLAQDEITTYFGFDVRQTQYYTQASQYLGLVERSQDNERGVTYSLTSLGAQIVNKAPNARNLALAELILAHRVFRDAMNYYLEHAQAPPADAVIALMVQAGIRVKDKLMSADGTTAPRRAQTVIGWVRWIMGLTANA